MLNIIRIYILLITGRFVVINCEVHVVSNLLGRPAYRSYIVEQKASSVEGLEVEISNFSYNVVILKFISKYGLWSVSCGGTLIGRGHVLTAASCVVVGIDSQKQNIIKYSAANFRIRYGSSHCSKGGEQAQVALILVHPLYYTEKYNVAVLKLKDDIKESEITPIPLAGPEDTMNLRTLVRNKSACVTTGWGFTTTNDSEKRVYSDHLKLYKKTLLSWKDCQAKIEKAKPVYEFGTRFDYTAEMCTFDPNLPPCLIDSGNPLICDGIQFGISSWSYGCDREQQPDVFTRLDNNAIAAFIKFALDFEYDTRSSANKPFESVIFLTSFIILFKLS